MLAIKYEEVDGRYARYMTVGEIDEETLVRARSIFDEYRCRGVILNKSFDDMVWQLSDQKSNVVLDMNISEEIYNKNAMNWVGCSYRCYLECMKAYISFSLGKYGLSTLQGILIEFRELSGKTIDEGIASEDNLNHIIGLLQIIPGGNEKRDYAIEELEEKLERRKKNPRARNQRNLADFDTYLKFDEILGKFWHTATSQQKLFYFPLYFWWNLTAVLPLRPTEFLLTPRNCLKICDNGDSALTVRRTKLKSGFNKVSYRIAEDYECKTYIVDQRLAVELQSYLKETEKMRQTEIDTLFSQDPHSQYIGRKSSIKSQYYTYGNLLVCMEYFYQEVVWNQEGVKLNSIRLGDTRHLAMVNLITTGGSPVICRELAGHFDIETSSHYFTNISNLVECVTIARYRKTKGKGSEITGESKYTIKLPESRYRLSAGWCDAPGIMDGDISECLKVSDKDGQIGNCTHCIHYWPDEQGIRFKFLDEKISKDAVDADCKYLLRMIESVRKGIGYTEDIGAALLRLQRSCDHYSKSLWEKYMKAGECDS